MKEKNGKTKQAENKTSELLKTAMDRFQAAQEYCDADYKRGQEDVNFVLGDQWPQKIKEQRQSEGRPCLTENRLMPFVHQVVNQIRQARPAIRPKPVDSNADVDTAEVLQGIIRNIETSSDAETAYDTAAYNAVSASIGWIRVNTQYADERSFDQELCIERVLNPFSVLLDPNAKRLDGADANYAFIFDDMDIEEFKELYPDASTEGFEVSDEHTDWTSEDKIRIAEYYYREYETKTLVRWRVNVLGEPIEQISLIDVMPENAEIIEERSVEIPVIKYCKITAADVLEETEVLGKYIPIVPVVGFETWRDGKRELYSLIHQAKDPQSMFNYWKTASTEVVALQPKAPFVGAVGQFNSKAQQWVNANRENYAFLEYDPVIIDGVPMPPPQRQAPPTSSGIQLQEAMAAADGIKASLGMYDASMGEQTNDISGKAIIARQLEGDNSTFHFVDNLSTAMKHVGRILVDLIPKVYSEARIVRILGEDGTENMVPVNQPYGKDQKGNKVPLEPGMPQEGFHKLDAGKYDVVVEVGPAYATRRQEAANAILELSRADSRVLEVAGDIFIKSLDIPNAEEIAKRLRAIMDPALLGDDVEAQRLQTMQQGLAQLEQQLKETQAALDAKKNNQEFENQLELKKLEIDSAKTMAEIKKIEAEINQSIPAASMQDIAAAITELKAQSDDINAAFDLFLSAQEEKATGEPI
mgnify:CR=1 FL=1